MGDHDLTVEKLWAAIRRVRDHEDTPEVEIVSPAEYERRLRRYRHDG